jgi:two-component system NtrC family sensor kinase
MIRHASKIREIDRTIRWTAIRHVLKSGVKERNVSGIQQELVDLLAEEKIDFLTLIDRNGKVVFRFHNPEGFGDSLLRDPFVRKALEKKGVSGTQVLSREELLREKEDFADGLLFN